MLKQIKLRYYRDALTGDIKVKYSDEIVFDGSKNKVVNVIFNYVRFKTTDNIYYGDESDNHELNVIIDNTRLTVYTPEIKRKRQNILKCPHTFLFVENNIFTVIPKYSDLTLDPTNFFISIKNSDTGRVYNNLEWVDIYMMLENNDYETNMN